MSQNFCTTCGAPRVPGNNACTTCGTFYSPEPAEHPGYQQVGFPQPGHPPLQATTRLSRGVLVAIAAGIVAALVAMGLFLIFKSSPEEQIEKAARVLVEADNDECDKLEKYATADDIDQQVKDCEDRADRNGGSGANTRFESISAIDIDGDRATAKVTFAFTDESGGDSESSTQTFGFRKVDGDWKVDLDYADTSGVE